MDERHDTVGRMIADATGDLAQTLKQETPRKHKRAFAACGIGFALLAASFFGRDSLHDYWIFFGMLGLLILPAALAILAVGSKQQI